MKKNRLMAIILCFILLFTAGCSKKAEVSDTQENTEVQQTEENQAEDIQQQEVEVSPSQSQDVSKEGTSENVSQTSEVGSGEIITVPNVSNESLETTGMKYLSIEVGTSETERNFV